MEDLSYYNQLRIERGVYYRTLNRVFSPAFNQDVYFNSKGFNHLIYKRGNKEREKSSQILRLKLLPLGVKLLKLSTTHQEFEETIKEFKIRKRKNKTRKLKPVKYWGIIAIIEKRKIKIVVRQIGDLGHLHFWSIIPSWKTSKYRDIKFFRTIEGDLEED